MAHHRTAGILVAAQLLSTVTLAQTSVPIVDFGSYADVWGSNSLGQSSRIGTYVQSYRTWYEDPLRNDPMGGGAPSPNVNVDPLWVQSYGQSQYYGLAEFEVPTRTSGKDWFVVVTPRSVLLGVGSGDFRADFMRGDGYVTLGDATQTPELSRSFGITNDYSKWYQYVGERFDKISGVPGYSWIGIMSMGSVLLRVPDSFESGSIVSMRISTASGGLLFPMPGLIELKNPSGLDVTEASNFFASSVPEPSTYSQFFVGTLLLAGVFSGRAHLRRAHGRT